MLKLLSIFVIFCLYKESVLSEIINPKLPEKVTYQLEDIGELFEDFIAKYNKQYNSAELVHRRMVFVDNLIKINRWNRDQPNAVFGIGPFADLTFEEFSKTHTGCLLNFTSDNVVKYVPTGMAPDSLDWRQSNLVTRVRNQQNCGSCYVFAAIGNIEGQYAKKHGNLIELSEQQGLDCNPRNCDGGIPHEVMQSLVNQGCMKESDYPYESAKGQCRSDPNKVVVRVTDGQQLSVSSEDALKDAVASIGPIAVGISTNEQMPGFQGGIFKPTSCNGDGHAVLVVGYGTDGGVPYWLIKNSWGEQWSENGYLRLIRGRGACNIGNYAASATVA